MMSSWAIFVPLLLVFSAVKQTHCYNTGVLTMPLFQMLVKDLPHDEIDAKDDFANATEFFNKLKVLDEWKANPFLQLETILNDKIITIINDGRVLFDRKTLKADDLPGYNCTRWCYNVSVPLILNVTGWSEERLDGKVSPVVRMQDIHNAMVKVIEKRFCSNMTAIAIKLNLDNGVIRCASDINIWEMFVPHINDDVIKCKADYLKVTPEELAELLRTNLTVLRSYDLNQLESNFFPAYENLLNRKNLFETKSIITGVLVNAPQLTWLCETMAKFADIVSQFTIRDLEILYRWESPQLFAIQNIPMSVYNSGCNSIAPADSLFKLSQTLFGFSTNLPACDIAFLLSRSLNEVNTKFTVLSIDDQNVLEIFRNESMKYSWFDFYQLLQLKIDEGIWVETPLISQVAGFSSLSLAAVKESSIPQVVSYIQNFNKSTTLNSIMLVNYPSFLTKLLNSYGYSNSGLASAAGITVTQLNSLTIQAAHGLVLTSIMQRYNISHMVSAVGIPGVDFHILTNLPSFEWERIIRAAIQAAFNQSADAYSIKLIDGGVQITTANGGFASIQVSNTANFHVDRISPSELASCLGESLPSIYALSFTEYHNLFSTRILPILQNKVKFETRTMESLLQASGLQFDNVKTKTVSEVITQLTGLTIENIGCFYPWNSTFLTTDLAKTFENANTTRLCNDFLGLTMYNIVVKIQQTADKVCFLCTQDPCGGNAVCEDIPDSYKCTCNKGYTGDGKVGCVDIPECLWRLDTCHTNATCRDTGGSYNCTCNKGFDGNGEVCADIKECEQNPTRCGPKGICVNTIGSFYCTCESGYQWNGTACIDFDECKSNKHNCSGFATCNNTDGSFTCQCLPGFTGNGVQCTDILECNFQAHSYPCHVRANCTELTGSYRCQCKTGYSGDGEDCVDIDECKNKTDNCDANAQCSNTEGSYLCQCNTGFTGNGVTCSDIDECQEKSHNCHKDANCNNTFGSFTCDCKDGFNGNGTYCYVAQVSFVQNAYSVTEGGAVEVTISLSGAIDSIAVVSIIATGTATSTSDYTINTASVVFFPNGASTEKVRVETKDDQKLEKTESITLTLSPLSITKHVEAGGNITTTISIEDNDAVTVTLSQDTYNVAESDAFANVTIQISSGTVEREISVSVTSAPDTAMADVDYTKTTQSVQFAPGNTGPKFVRIPLKNDDLTENNETFSVLLSTADDDVNLATKTATVIIEDDDAASARFESNSYTVDEGDKVVKVKVVLTGTLEIPVTARLTTRDGAAMSNKDYQNLSNFDFNFIPNGPTTASINITVMDDVIFEDSEVFFVMLTSQSPQSLRVVNPTATVTITDNDFISVQFKPTTYDVEEENTEAKVKVAVSGSFEKRLDLSISTANDTAIAGTDYEALVGTPLIFNVGDPDEKELAVQILEDVIIEGPKSFFVRMTSTDSKIRFSTGHEARINIHDDDFAIAYLQSPQETVRENISSMSLPVQISGTLAIPQTVRLSTVHDTASWPSDYTSVTNHDIVFNPGDNVKHLTLEIEDDSIVENTERFYVILTAVTSQVTIGKWNRTAVLIEDNDKLHVKFSSPTYAADEESGFAKVGLVLQETLEKIVNVRLTPSNGTATEPEDFHLRTYDVMLGPGLARTVYYNISITNDMKEEYSEHFLVSLTSLSSQVEIVEPRHANVTIAESDDIYFCDPNAKQYPCHIKADCVDVPGSFVCTCMTGYEGDGYSCKNKNECLNETCAFNATCQDTEGSYKCICGDGYIGDGVGCKDIDECDENKDDCDHHAYCTNTPGSFNCTCKTGYDGTGKVCSDIDECKRNTANCHANATCNNTAGSFNCSCLPGFRGDGVQCVDIDECIEKTHLCSTYGTCSDTIGSYTCACNAGFTGNGFNCTDIDECDRNIHNCPSNSSCNNTDGSFTCQCNPGFQNISSLCKDINECDRNTHNCPSNSSCINNVGSFTCQCNPGFQIVNSVCQDIDECKNSTTNDCHSDAICINERGTFECKCREGFTGDGRTQCSDINECEGSTNLCHQYANCTDTHGSYKCTCLHGYTGNGTYCEDIIDCIEAPKQYPCDIRATCTDVAGGFTCTCPSGFNLNSDQYNCDDINECDGSPGCSVNASCINTDGSYQCKCKENFFGDGKTCIDMACTSQNPCSEHAICSVNVTTSSFQCICNEGFTGDGYTCTDIDECIDPSSCGPNTNCTDTMGSYNCTCKSGFAGDPKSSVGCTDIDECRPNNPCDGQAECSNMPGTYTCTCKSGYAGPTCENIDECLSYPCRANATCQDNEGSYKCTCKEGYTGDGETCTDIDECKIAGSCGANATCINVLGNFSCSCKSGFTGNPKVQCDDIDECKSNPCEIGAQCVDMLGTYRCVCPENLYRNGNFCHAYCPFKLDLAFIVDTSQSISPEDFVKVRDFMIQSVAKMEIGEHANHIAVIDFGNKADVFMYFNTISGPSLTRPAVMNYLSNLTQKSGLTRIDLALMKAETEVFVEAQGMRTSKDIRKVGVVITDGRQTTGQGVPIEPLADIAKRIHSKDVALLAIGIGSEISRDQLRNITNSNEEHILEVNNFDNLESVIFQFINMSCTDVDECKLHKPCHEHANCKDTLGAYSCLCKTGFSGNGFDCQDIDECKGANNCDSNADCTNTEGSYICICKSGFSGDGKTCSDINECNGNNNCDTSANCTNTNGSYTCTCKSGYTGNGFTCSDFDECKGDNNCDSNADCTDTEGSYTCTCKSGFSGDGKTCSAVGVCSPACNANSTCINLGGMAACQCKTGFTVIGNSCIDDNECNGNNSCDTNADCTNTMGSYACTCKTGYTGNGLTCSAIPACSLNCGANAACINNGGNFTCRCNSGYSGDGTTCTDNNECNGNNSCDTNADCTNTNGSYTCACKTGYTGNGFTCSNINECNSNNNCNTNADCTDTMGSYTCACKTGFTGDGFSCSDIIECDGNNVCHANADCKNTQGSYQCVCKSGYAGDGSTCIDDIDECQNSTVCGSGQTCQNYPGTYECFCSNPGQFLLNGSCTDVSTVNVQIKILNEIFVQAMAEQNSLEFYKFSKRLQDKINEFVTAIYEARYLGSTIQNLSEGSVLADILLHFKLGTAPSMENLMNDLNSHLNPAPNGEKKIDTYVIQDVTTASLKDYDECHPSFGMHFKACPAHANCFNSYASYSCDCTIGYEKVNVPDHTLCVVEDDDWWIVYAVVFGAMLLVVLFLIFFFCVSEVTKNKEQYTLHDEEGKNTKSKQDKRVNEEVAPGFPGSIPRTTSTSSQLLLGTDKKSLSGSMKGSERLAMYEVNPIYDSAND